MGQVYQATDTKLNRQVALKILPEAFATDPDRLARFQREAQVLASLNHPGIAAIYGIEEDANTRALVLELVEGPTLADRISKGPIPVDEALPIAKQIAEALEAAHEAGVIHRDLKPANIKVRQDGTVKVLDFGLAKAMDTAPEGDPNESPTLTAAATQMGVIMGTAAYMSPEQARGKPVDKRSDIWAFGCVLYEMITGRRAFTGETVTDTLAAVMTGIPDWSALPSTMSPTLLLFLKHCVNKDPHERVRDLGDVRLALTGAFDSVLGSGTPKATPRRTAWFVGFSAAALLAGIAIGLGLQPSPPIGPVIQSIVSGAPNPAARSRALFRDVELSPDGSHVVYTSTEGRREQLFVRALDSLEGWAIPGSGAGDAAISPDSEWIAFSSNETGLFSKVAVSGGQSSSSVA